MQVTLDLTDTEVQQLREVMDSVPLSGYANVVLKVLKALPATSNFSVAPDTRALQILTENLRGVRQ